MKLQEVFLIGYVGTFADESFDVKILVPETPEKHVLEARGRRISLNF